MKHTDAGPALTNLADAFNAHCDELAELVDEREDGLKASAEACENLHRSVRNLQWWQGLSLLATLLMLVATIAR